MTVKKNRTPPPSPHKYPSLCIHSTYAKRAPIHRFKKHCACTFILVNKNIVVSPPKCIQTERRTKNSMLESAFPSGAS